MQQIVIILLSNIFYQSVISEAFRKEGLFFPSNFFQRAYLFQEYWRYIKYKESRAAVPISQDDKHYTTSNSMYL